MALNFARLVSGQGTVGKCREHLGIGTAFAAVRRARRHRPSQQTREDVIVGRDSHMHS
jgi:hypothetical protein